MRGAAAAVLLVAVTIGDARASTLYDTLGTETCVTLTRVEEKLPGHSETLFLDWMEGFLAGAREQAKLAGSDVAINPVGFGANERFAIALDYCRSHPDAKFHEAAKAVFEVLRQHSGR